MKSLELKSHRFRAEREGGWRRLDALLGKAEGGRMSQLSDDELLELPLLYRSAMSSLSVARATSLDANLVAYLESLATRAYFFIYGTRISWLDRVTRFFRHDWPAATKALWRETAISLGIFLVTALVGYWLVAHDPDWYNSIMPGDMAQGRDPSATTEYLKSTIYNDHGKQYLSTFAAFLFMHNARVTIFSFALGFVFCAPTVFMICETGLTFGAIVALYASHGLGFQMIGWLMIHGATELSAIILGGAAGLKIGWTVMFPGARPRLEAAALATRSVGAVMIGTVIMLLFAGCLEGVGRQLIQLDWARYTIAITTFSFWAAYFYLPRSGKNIR